MGLTLVCVALPLTMRIEGNRVTWAVNGRDGYVQALALGAAS